MELGRILFFLDFPNALGGAANTLLRQAAVIKKYASDVLVTIPVNDEGSVIDEFENICKRYGLRYSFQKYSVSITAEVVDIVGILKNCNNMEKYIERYNPDIVHSAQINVCVEMVCRKLGIAHIMNVYQCTEHIFRLDYPDIFPRYHICDSRYYQKRWKKRLQLDSICIRNICEIVDVKKWKLQDPVLVCVGNLCERKNQLEVIKAVHLLLLDGVSVYIYFYGYDNSIYGEKCIKYIEENRIGDRVKIKGFVPAAEVEIAKCDALVCGSKSESFPNVIGEAMAGRTAVISTPVAGVPEILKNNENAYLCEGYKAEDIYLAIKVFYAQRGTQAQKDLVERAFQTYLKEFSPNAVANKLLDYYKFVFKDNFEKGRGFLHISNILSPYTQFISLFEENEKNFRRPLEMRSMIWLIPYIRNSLESKSYKELIIWGAGIYGADAMLFAKIYFPQLTIKCFIDKEKVGDYLGCPICRVENVNWENSLIWIAFVYGQLEAIKILSQMKLEYHKDFFFLAPMNL